MSLLAKKGRTTLLEHSEQVEEACVAFLNSPLGTAWKSMWGFDDYEWAKYCLNLRVASLLHDIGKANGGLNSFQVAVGSNGFIKQSFRHEHISAFIVVLLMEWLQQNKDLDSKSILRAVAGHHLKLDQDSDQGKHPWGDNQEGTPPRVQLLLEDSDVKGILKRVGDLASLGPAPELKLSHLELGTPDCTKLFKAGWVLATEINLHLRGRGQRFSIALGFGLIVADSLGSGLVRNNLDIKDWIGEQAGLALEPDEIRREIIDKHIAQVTGFKGLRPMQEQAEKAPARSLMIGACNSGKTLAAHLWSNSMVSKHRVGRSLFLYPTRATATEGFLDYVSMSVHGGLLHSSSKYELQEMRFNPTEEFRLRDTIQPPEKEQRLFALAHWKFKSFSATADQFFGFLYHQYGSLCLLPLVAAAAIVVDELHAWDKRMFDALLRFLDFFPTIPVLCMTATLQQDRVRDLKARGFYVIDSNDGESARLAELPRYNISQSTREECFNHAVRLYQLEQKVLWVVNTVDECQKISQELMSRGVNVLLYHSRYIGQDRKDRHRETIDAFKVGSRPLVAVTTQVCELSLDLQEAQAVITEYCPIPSFIQRLGRALRRLVEASILAPVYVYTREGTNNLPYNPYSKDDFDLLKSFLSRVVDRPLSQKDLSDEFERIDTSRKLHADAWAPALSGNFFPQVEMFRDITEVTCSCVLEEHLHTGLPGRSSILELAKSKEPLDAYTVPVLKSDSRLVAGTNFDLPPYIKVSLIGNYQYDSVFGYRKVHNAP